jgi:hypothetical protein
MPCRFIPHIAKIKLLCTTYRQFGIFPLEVALGGVTGFIVSVLLLPSKAHPLVTAAAAPTLDQMARALGELLAGLTQGLDVDSLHRIQDGIGHSLVQLNAIGAEAEHERSAGLAVGPDTGPLLRTLLRLRHDLVIIGRAAATPLPEAFRTRLKSPLARTGMGFADYLRASGAALQAGRGPPSLNAVELALDAYVAEVAALRREGLTRTLPGASSIWAGGSLGQPHAAAIALPLSLATRGPPVTRTP